MSSRNVRCQSRRGFSLIELLVVLFIIALVIAIIVPALGAARTLAKKTASQAMLNQVGQAAMQFQTDERRVPGYFTARDMGSTDNATRGMSGMENMMLDLAGGIVGSTATGPTIVSAGPLNSAARQVKVDTALIGVSTSSNKTYFAPPAKNYVAQLSGRGQIGDVAHTGAAEGDTQLKDLVDDFGQPILGWSIDEGVAGPVAALGDFVRLASDGTGNAVSRFYWNQNACFLNAPALGKLQKNQVGLSMLTDATNRLQNLTTVLGNPSSPVDPSQAQNAIIPSAARGGKFVLQSAGQDGIYCSKDDKGFKSASSGTGLLPYGANFRPATGQPYAKSIDVMVDFDDLLVGGGS